MLLPSLLVIFLAVGWTPPSRSEEACSDPRDCTTQRASRRGNRRRDSWLPPDIEELLESTPTPIAVTAKGRRARIAGASADQRGRREAAAPRRAQRRAQTREVDVKTTTEPAVQDQRYAKPRKLQVDNNDDVDQVEYFEDLYLQDEDVYDEEFVEDSTELSTQEAETPLSAENLASDAPLTSQTELTSSTSFDLSTLSTLTTEGTAVYPEDTSSTDSYSFSTTDGYRDGSTSSDADGLSSTSTETSSSTEPVFYSSSMSDILDYSVITELGNDATTAESMEQSTIDDQSTSLSSDFGAGEDSTSAADYLSLATTDYLDEESGSSTTSDSSMTPSTHYLDSTPEDDENQESTTVVADDLYVESTSTSGVFFVTSGLSDTSTEGDILLSTVHEITTDRTDTTNIADVDSTVSFFEVLSTEDIHTTETLTTEDTRTTTDPLEGDDETIELTSTELVDHTSTEYTFDDDGALELTSTEHLTTSNPLSDFETASTHDSDETTANEFSSETHFTEDESTTEHLETSSSALLHSTDPVSEASSTADSTDDSSTFNPSSLDDSSSEEEIDSTSTSSAQTFDTADVIATTLSIDTSDVTTVSEVITEDITDSTFADSTSLADDEHSQLRSEETSEEASSTVTNDWASTHSESSSGAVTESTEATVTEPFEMTQDTSTDFTAFTESESTEFTETSDTAGTTEHLSSTSATEEEQSSVFLTSALTSTEDDVVSSSLGETADTTTREAHLTSTDDAPSTIFTSTEGVTTENSPMTEDTTDDTTERTTEVELYTTEESTEEASSEESTELLRAIRLLTSTDFTSSEPLTTDEGSTLAPKKQPLDFLPFKEVVGKTPLETLVEEPDLSFLGGAIYKNEKFPVLKKIGMTIFAPVDSAFAGIPIDINAVQTPEHITKKRGVSEANQEVKAVHRRMRQRPKPTPRRMLLPANRWSSPPNQPVYGSGPCDPYENGVPCEPGQHPVGGIQDAVPPLFGQAMADSQARAPKNIMDDFEKLIMFHVVKRIVPPGMIESKKSLVLKTEFKGRNLDLHLTEDGLIVGDHAARVVGVIACRNGYIYKVDRPLFPAWNPGKPNILDLIRTSPNFTRLKYLLDESGLFDAWAYAGPITMLLIPDNAWRIDGLQVPPCFFKALVRPENLDTLNKLLRWTTIPGLWTKEDIEAVEWLPNGAAPSLAVTTIDMEIWERSQQQRIQDYQNKNNMMSKDGVQWAYERVELNDTTEPADNVVKTRITLIEGKEVIEWDIKFYNGFGHTVSELPLRPDLELRGMLWDCMDMLCHECPIVTKFLLKYLDGGGLLPDVTNPKAYIVPPGPRPEWMCNGEKNWFPVGWDPTEWYKYLDLAKTAGPGAMSKAYNLAYNGWKKAALNVAELEDKLQEAEVHLRQIYRYYADPSNYVLGTKDDPNLLLGWIRNKRSLEYKPRICDPKVPKRPGVLIDNPEDPWDGSDPWQYSIVSPQRDNFYSIIDRDRNRRFGMEDLRYVTQWL